MKWINIFCILISIESFVVCQTVPKQFSPYSDHKITNSHLIKGKNGFILDAWLLPIDNHYRHFLFTISEEGDIIDSFNLTDGYKSCSGQPVYKNNHIYFLGSTDSGTFPTQRYAAFEFDDNLNMQRRFESPIFDIRKGFHSFYQSSGGGAVNRLHDFTVDNDTIFGIGNYLMVDSPLVFLGFSAYYLKAHIDGDIYIDKQVDNGITNCFFRKNTLYKQGSILNPADPWLNFPVASYNHEGDFIKGWIFDKSYSGEFPYNASGGSIDDLLYFAYIGLDNTLPGCPENNVTIDIRDTNFQNLHRFKIPECGYKFAGNMPFTKGIDGSIYFQAVHEDYKRMILKKYTPTMQQIWSKEYDFSTDSFYTIPVEMVPTNDGGVIMHHHQMFGSKTKIRLYKVSSNGEIISSIEVPAQTQQSEASVLSPNPCTDFTQYTGSHQGDLTALIFGINGQVPFKRTLEAGKLDFTDLIPGLYQVLLFDPSNLQQVLHTQTVVKIK